MYKAWHWPKSWLPKGHRQFWCKLIGFSLLGHLILLFFGFFYDKRDKLQLTVFSQTRLVEVVVLPFYKKIPNVQKMVNEAPKTSSQKSKIVPKKVVTKEPAKRVSVSKEVVKQEPKKTETKKIAPQKIAPKKNDKIKPVEPVKKIEPVKPEPVKQEIKQEVISEPNEPIYIGRHDLKNLQMAQELEAVIVKSWQPPLGFGPDTECTVELMVDGAGKVTNFVIKKSSNIVVYDLSVKRIFTQIVMPIGVRNKTLTIVFRQ